MNLNRTKFLVLAGTIMTAACSSDDADAPGGSTPTVDGGNGGSGSVGEDSGTLPQAGTTSEGDGGGTITEGDGGGTITEGDGGTITEGDGGTITEGDGGTITEGDAGDAG
jgi:hypothetical protein